MKTNEIIKLDLKKKTQCGQCVIPNKMPCKHNDMILTGNEGGRSGQSSQKDKANKIKP